MMNPDDFWAQVYTKLALFASGIAGAFVSLSKNRKLTILERVVSLISGGFTAVFITPVAVSFLKMGDNGMLFCAFLTGFSGFKSVEIAIDELKKRLPGKNS